MGLADSVITKGRPCAAAPARPGCGWLSLRPRQYDTLAIVHRRKRSSRGGSLMIELATARIQAVAEPIGPR